MAIKSELPELPSEKAKRFVKELNIKVIDAAIVTENIHYANNFEALIKLGIKEKVDPQKLANFVINRKINLEEELPASVVKQYLQASATLTVNEDELDKIIDKVISDNTRAVEDFKKGKETVIMFLVGQVMRQFKQKIDASQVKASLLAKLK